MSRVSQRSRYAVCILLLAIPVLPGCGSHEQEQPKIAAAPAQNMPSQTQDWVAQKVKDTGGDYSKLSAEDKQQFDLLGHGHGEMFFNMSKR